MDENTPVVILAGGQSRRMGQDKAELVIHDKRLIDIVIARILKQRSHIVISGSHDYQTKLPTISDFPDGPKGPVGGIYAAYIWCRASKIETGFFTAPIDAPALPSDLCERLWNPERSQYASGSGRTHPAFAWWRIADLHPIFEGMDFTISQSLHQLVGSVKAQAVLWDSATPFFNINTPNDVQEYLTRK